MVCLLPITGVNSSLPIDRVEQNRALVMISTIDKISYWFYKESGYLATFNYSMFQGIQLEGYTFTDADSSDIDDFEIFTSYPTSSDPQDTSRTLMTVEFDFRSYSPGTLIVCSLP